MNSAKQFETRIYHLEDQTIKKLLNNGLALDWHSYLTRTKSILNWLWETERIRPNSFPTPMRSYFFPTPEIYRSALKRWRSGREQHWQWEYKKLDIIQKRELGLENIKTKFPCPDETSTRRLMGQLLASMPESIFIWTKSTGSFYESYYRTYRKAPLHKDRPPQVLLDFFAVGDRAKYWRHRLGSIDLMEIDLPGWAIMANKEVHHLEGGMLPLFKPNLSS